MPIAVNVSKNSSFVYIKNITQRKIVDLFSQFSHVFGISEPLARILSLNIGTILNENVHLQLCQTRRGISLSLKTGLILTILNYRKWLTFMLSLMGINLEFNMVVGTVRLLMPCTFIIWAALLSCCSWWTTRLLMKCYTSSLFALASKLAGTASRIYCKT